MSVLTEWTPIIGFTRSYVRGDRLLSVSLAPIPGGGYNVIALEVPDGASNEELLAEHSHKMLGHRKSESGAKRLGERFAAAWLERSSASKLCDCEEVPA